MASKDNNSLVISFSFFVLLSLGFAVAWYFSWDFSNELKQKIADATAAEATAKSAIKNLQNEVASLQALTGQPGGTDEIVEGTRALVGKYAADPSQASSAAELALTTNAQGRELASSAATDRLLQTGGKIAELNKQVETHEADMRKMKADLAQKELDLRTKEKQHSAKLEEEEAGIDSKKAELRAEQDAYTLFMKNSEVEIDKLNKEIARQRQALIVLRREKLKLQGATFERADGTVTMVDLSAGTCYIDLGTRDELRLGTEFSVYSVGSMEVGQALNAKAKKGRIEIVALLEDHLAEARIVFQEPSKPIAPRDFIFSSLFERGQKLQIAVVGMLEFDGNPGSDREEFKRIASSAGIDVVVEVNDDARILGRDGDELSLDDISTRITAATRFLVIGGSGDMTTADETRKLIYEQIDVCQKEMVKAAENNGVYVLSLSSFLDFVGYSSKRLVNSESSSSPR